MHAVMQVLDYTVESGGIAALDYKSRLLYWIGQKTNAGVNDPFYLIGLSLTDASVRVSVVCATPCPHCVDAAASLVNAAVPCLACLQSAAYLCDADAACPWTLEYANPK